MKNGLALDSSTRLRIAELINRVIVPVSFVSLLILVGLIHLLSEGQYHRLIAPLIAISFLVPAFYLSHKGYPLRGLFFVHAAILLGIASGMIFNGGIRAPAFIATLTFAPIFVVLYGLRGGILYFLATALIGAVFMFLDTQGMLYPFIEPPSLLLYTVHCVLLALLIFLVLMPVRLMNRALKDVKIREQALIDTNTRLNNEIAERRRIESLLHDREHSHQSLANNIPVGLFRATTRGKVISINAHLQKLLGISDEAVNTDSITAAPFFVHAEDRKQFMDLVRKDTPVKGFECQLQTCDDVLIWVSITAQGIADDDGTIKYLDGIIEDITLRREAEAEQDKLQEQLLQSQKMQAVGTLASGVAHDFNNLLMGIQGRASLLSHNLQPSDPSGEHLKAIEEYIQSATGLTRQLLGTVKGGKYNPTPTDLNVLVEKSADLFGRTRKEIQITIRKHNTPVVTEIDRQQLDQVLLNIYVNAWHAMPDGGNLYIHTSIEDLDDVSYDNYQVSRGKYGKITIRDTGIGMNESTRQRIFDPFFTTKDKGRGTGLGLSSAYGIIKNHGGFITVNSIIGNGTTFDIYLPLSAEQPASQSAVQAEIIEGSETILLVDDEELIIEVGRALLETIGYNVFTAKGGKEAIQIVSDHGKTIDLVILDLIMPELDGGETFDQIRSIAPSIPVLLSSGYAIDGQATEILRRGGNGFIQKPFSLSQLSQKIRKSLKKIG